MLDAEIVLTTLEDTEAFGLLLGLSALPGDVVCLDGELGSGKTTLTQAIAKGLGVPPTCYVTSPSFSILQEYPGRIPLYHMDFYRIYTSEEVEDLGFVEYFYMAGLTVVEWAARAERLLPQERLSVTIRIGADGRRIVRCVSVSERWESVITQLSRNKFSTN